MKYKFFEFKANGWMPILIVCRRTISNAEVLKHKAFNENNEDPNGQAGAVSSNVEVVIHSFDI